MANILSFRKIVASLGLVTVVSSPTTVVIAAFTSNEQNKEKTANNVDMVVNAINATQYEQVVDINSRLNDFEREINTSFIKGELAAWVRKIFEDDFFTINKVTKENGEKLSNKDFKKTGIINAKINYNYDYKKNQVTTLKIEVVSPVRPNLSDVFEDFEFVDQRDIAGFLDTTDIDIITEQVLNYLALDDLNQIGLIFTDKTSNSITLKAKNNSKLYSGEVELTWNLKLFEIYGIEDDKDNSNQWIAKGLKGFFYLDKNDNNIKFFDFQDYTGTDLSSMHYFFEKYHEFIFTNKNKDEKDFTFNGKKNARENRKKFGTFDFDKGVKVVFYSPEHDRIKVFNKNTNSWKGFEKSSEFDINALGELNQIT